MHRAQRVAGSDECHVRYGPYDALDNLLSYGFVDRSAPFVRSVPFEVDLGEAGLLRVGGRVAGMKQGKFPPKVADLRLFLPTVTAEESGLLEVSHLIVPGRQAPQALRRVLALLLARLAPETGAAARQAMVRRMESTLLERNIAYYQELIEEIGAVRDVPQGARVVLDMAKEAADFQLARLREYQASIGLTAA